MDRMVAAEHEQEPWSLQSDKDLLRSLQDLSGDLLHSMQRIEGVLSTLEQDAATLTARTGNANATFKGLCETQFIEQVVEAGTPMHASTGQSAALKRPPTLTPDNFSQIVHPKYMEALSLAAAAFKEEPCRHLEGGQLPHIFGSPEYLQDATFGIGSSSSEFRQALQQPEVGAVQGTAADAANVPDVEDDKDVQDEVPDFRSMLEAVLRGDLDTIPTEAFSDAADADAAMREAHASRYVVMPTSQTSREQEGLQRGGESADSIGHAAASDRDEEEMAKAELRSSKVHEEGPTSMNAQVREGNQVSGSETHEAPEQELSLQELSLEDLLQNQGQLFRDEELAD